MINLIPPEGRKAVTREYWIRMSSAWGFLLSAVFVATLLLFIPSYVLVTSQLSSLEGDRSSASETEGAFRSAEEKIQTTNTAISKLGSEENETAFSLIIDSIWKEVGSSISLRRLEIYRSEGEIQPIQVYGEALTREALAGYKTSLERSALFEIASIPISDLARDANLPFMVTITLPSIRN